MLGTHEKPVIISKGLDGQHLLEIQLSIPCPTSLVSDMRAFGPYSSRYAIAMSLPFNRRQWRIATPLEMRVASSRRNEDDIVHEYSTTSPGTGSMELC